ncbi:hypothetical protein CDD81_3425 [Ophiocordyceps australis]|uniref:Uncharacterized protein n=1 Tax=Ophiocordyceps australis TaxID=1399860 RepID=A0A2C5Y8I8_9HYPO|nr:hypothetical protein CDD81_3425 [Ophiocordyceps australis]
MGLDAVDKKQVTRPAKGKFYLGPSYKEGSNMEDRKYCGGQENRGKAGGSLTMPSVRRRNRRRRVVESAGQGCVAS